MSFSARSLTVASVALVLGGFSACGSGADAPPGEGGGTGGLGAIGGGGASGAGAGTGGSLVDTGLDDSFNPDGACAAIDQKGDATPLHLYIMLDKSSSMSVSGGEKWNAAVAGITAFVSDANSAGIYVGLKFFPRDPDSTVACDQKSYSTPDTPFDLLPGNKDPIITAISAETPDGLNTPTWPALGGGILKGIEIAQNNPGHTAAVLLVTDGVPQGPAPLCSGVDPTDTAEIAKLAQLGAAFTPPVLTFVIGLPGVDQTFANAVAAAGGTQSAILVSNTNVQKEFTDALSKVRGQALPCEYELPADVASGKYDTGHVNAQITPGSGSAQPLLQGDCAKGGDWNYDDDTNPTKIVLCPGTCSGLKADYLAHIVFLLGCKTNVIK
jgi:hypothetical protein